MNYGYCRIPLSSKSNEKTTVRRDSMIENRISRKYKEKFNQSLVSKSRDKIQQNRSRINSSVIYPKNVKRTVEMYKENVDMSNFMEDFEIKSKKIGMGGGKKACSVAIKCDTTKSIKARRY